MKKIVKSLLPFVFSILIAIPVIIPYFHKGYFPTHDGEWAIVRLADMFRTLRDLQIPPRYSGALNFGYGYPLFNFTYPSPYYLGTSFHFLGIGFVDTIKILFAGSVVFSGFFMILTSWNLWKNTWAGVVSAIFYIYLPYRMVDLYVRGSIGESLSFVLFPLLFYLSIKLIEKPSHLWVFGTAISLAVLVTTHNIMTVLFLPIWILFIVSKVIFNKKKYSIKPIIISILLGIGLSAFFWIPALFEKHLILLSQTPIADRNLYFVKLDQLLLSRWGYGAPTDPNGFSYQFGIPHLTVLFLAIFVLFFIWFSRRTQLKDSAAKASLLLIGLTLVFIFLLFRPSAFIWEHLPLLSEINYPWTTLGILGFLASLLAGFLCRQKITKYIVICLSLISIVMYLPYAKPQYYVDRGDNYYLTNEATTTSSSELMPLWVKEIPVSRFENKVEIKEGKGEIKDLNYNSKSIAFNFSSNKDSKLRINTIYYPGWSALVNNQKAEINYTNEKGVIELVAPKGENKVELTFSETPLRFFADFLSFISILFLVFYGSISRKGQDHIKVKVSS